MNIKKEIKAAAIKYSKEDLEIPVISALGSGEIAIKIIEEAKKNGIDIVKNSDFFKFEDLFKSGNEIPIDVYKIVVDILSYIINTNKGDN
ncbi:MAG: EscU/YscU/HrcU family type III secretion system export apparatus switch protein [Spirochaetes bacterium]|nr:EscU/YscU/HrcU family type III secretion system export apparatus switch protein [Spirochaetota bacterium]